MHGVVVDQLHVLLQTMVHECDAICSAWVIGSEFVTLILEPLDLVPPDAVHSAGSHAVCSASTEEPESKVGNVVMDAVLNGQFVRELMVHGLTIELVVVRHRGCILLLKLQLEHLILIDIRLEVVEAWHEAPGHLQAGKSVSQWLVVLFPEFLLCAVPCLSADNITCDSDKVRLLFANERSDHRESLMIQMTLVDFAHVQICQLHDLEVIVGVHFEVKAIQSIEVVLSEGCLCAKYSH